MTGRYPLEPALNTPLMTDFAPSVIVLLRPGTRPTTTPISAATDQEHAEILDRVLAALIASDAIGKAFDDAGDGDPHANGGVEEEI